MSSAFLTTFIGFGWMPFRFWCGIWRGLFFALCLLLLFILLPHGIFDRLKAFVRRGVLLCIAFAYSLPQLVEREFGVWILLWHNQDTSDLASSKHRPIFILTLS